MELVNDIIPKKDNKIDLTSLDVSRFKHPKQKLKKICYDWAITEYLKDIEDDLTRKITLMKMNNDHDNFNNNRDRHEENEDIYINDHDPQHPQPTTQPQNQQNPPDHHPPNHQLQTPGKNFMDHGNNITKDLPSKFIVTQRAIIFNALPTDTKNHKPLSLKPKGTHDNPFPCYMCWDNPDTIHHIFGHCPGVTKAREQFSKQIGVDLKHTPHHYGLAFNPNINNTDTDTTTARKTTNATVIFNHSVWHTRTHYYTTKHIKESEDDISKRITTNANYFWNRYTPNDWHTDIHNNPPDHLYVTAHHKHPSHHHNAKNTLKNKIKNINPDHHIAYTEGKTTTTKPNNTKHSGLGIHYLIPHHHPTPIKKSYPTGGQGNLYSTLFAMGYAITTFTELSIPDKKEQLHIISTNKKAIQIINNSGYKYTTRERHTSNTNNQVIIQQIRTLIRNTNKHRTINFHYSPPNIATETTKQTMKQANEAAHQSTKKHAHNKLTEFVAQSNYTAIDNPAHTPQETDDIKQNTQNPPKKDDKQNRKDKTSSSYTMTPKAMKNTGRSTNSKTTTHNPTQKRKHQQNNKPQTTHKRHKTQHTPPIRLSLIHI